MIYRSNLRCPDLTQHFKHLHVREMPHSHGHSVASDWADKPEDDPVFGLYKNCGLLTHDEAAIVWNVASRAGGPAIDIGAHSGWSTAHLAPAGELTAVEPMLRVQGFLDRFEENTAHCWSRLSEITYLRSHEFLPMFPPRAKGSYRWKVALVDGDHSEGMPLQDARDLLPHLGETAVVMFHDGTGRPVREAVTWLMDQGFQARLYWTPHLLFCCWRGAFHPQSHEHDRTIDWRFHVKEMSNDFDFSRLT